MKNWSVKSDKGKKVDSINKLYECRFDYMNLNKIISIAAFVSIKCLPEVY